jgi:hypothetical protein
MAKQRQATIISLDERRRRLSEENLREASRQMIEAEHALFVALRLAGHRGEETPAVVGPGRVLASAKGRPLAPVLPLRPRRKRAA